jgi:hypothetical protein
MVAIVVLVFVVLFVIGQFKIAEDSTFHYHTAECAQGYCPFDEENLK